MFRSLLISIITVCLSLILPIENALPAKKPYDDFSSGYISDERWWPREYVSEIVDEKLVCKLGNSEGMSAEFAPGIFRLNVTFNGDFVDINSIHTIQSEITVAEAILDNAADAKSFARVGGYFYNVNAAGGATGDIYAMVMLGDKGNGLESFWEVQRMLSDDTRTWQIIGEGTIPVTETLEYGTPYVAKLIYTPADPPGTPNPVFTFSVNGQTAEFEGPPYVREAQEVYKYLGAGINATNGSNSGFIYAKFDDVILNDSQSVFDDFSGTSIDASKWSSLDWVREVSSGRLRANLRGIDRGNMVSTYFPNEKDTPYLEAKVQIESDSVLSDGARAIARLGGYYYNETRGPGSGLPYNRYAGDVFAQVRLGYDSDGNLAAQAWVGRSEDPDQINMTRFFWHVFSTPISFDTDYILSIRYENKQLIFKCEDEQAVFNIQTETYQPYGIHRQLRTWLFLDQGESGYIKASYDDVYIGAPPITDAISALKIVSSFPLSDNEPIPTDYNSDNEISIADAIAAIQTEGNLRSTVQHSSMRYGMQAGYPSAYILALYNIEPFTITNATGPNISNVWQHNDTHSLIELSQKPNPGDTYSFTINYSDGTNENGSYTYTNMNENYAFIVTPADSSTVTTTTPTFVWSEANNIESYSLIVVDVSGTEKNTIWSVSTPAGTLSAVYNEDGQASELLSSGRSYEIYIHTFDEDGHQATTVSTFTVQLP